ncbi:MAG: ATP-grasp domain-containing protein [Alphaproteobacteria bacterium]|nr:ATP-grasp domain-containing protein [Alphaproteobacteria bacterium]
MPLRPPAGPRYPRFKRRIPERLFYVLPTLMWLTLSLRHGSVTLPTAANPAMEAGGLWGESKSQALDLFGPTGRRHLARFAVLDCVAGRDSTAAALAAMAEARVEFPVVGKPDRGYQGWGVRVLKTHAELSDYLAVQPQGSRILLQALVDLPGEAGVFYIRRPDEARGRIVSMAVVHPPHVIGDGRRTVGQLVQADGILRANADIYRDRHPKSWHEVLPEDAFHMLTNARSARLGAVYRDVLSEVTPELEQVIDDISREIPQFHFGRFDIRFASLDELRRGKGFCVVELNGAGAEMLHIWAGDARLGNAYRTLWQQYRTLFAIGARMRRQGVRPVGLLGMIRLQRQQEALRRIYPPSS